MYSGAAHRLQLIEEKNLSGMCSGASMPRQMGRTGKGSVRIKRGQVSSSRMSYQLLE